MEGSFVLATRKPLVNLTQIAQNGHPMNNKALCRKSRFNLYILSPWFLSLPLTPLRERDVKDGIQFLEEGR